MCPHRCKGWLNAKPQDPIAFAEKTREISHVYRLAPLLHTLGVHVVSLDEMTGIQALERLHPTLPMKPGLIERREFEFVKTEQLQDHIGFAEANLSIYFVLQRNDGQALQVDLQGQGSLRLMVEIFSGSCTRTISADIICLEDESLFDSRKFKTMGDLGRLLEDQFLSMLAYVADQERQKNRQRQAEGIEVAKQAGVKFGRPRIDVTDGFKQVIASWQANEITAVTAMKHLGLSKGTFYRRVKEYLH